MKAFIFENALYQAAAAAAALLIVFSSPSVPIQFSAHKSNMKQSITNRIHGRALAVPSLMRSPGSSRAATVTVHCNKLIKGANRPAASSKKGGSGKKGQLELNLQKLCTDSEYVPSRQIGPVEVAVKSGRGRCVVAKENLRPGTLLFVSETVGSALTGQLGQQLQPDHLSAHLRSSSRPLTAADKFKLSLLHRPGMAQTAPQQRVNFKDFSDDKAATKARKAAATSKGFGAAAAAAKQASTAAAAAADLSDEQLSAVLGCNAYGDDHLDGGLTSCRQEQQGSIIGVWPEFALLNHSCAPNTVPPVLLRDRLLLRSALSVPAGEELTTSYLDVAGGLPLQQRRGLLQANYGFTCNCHRCKAEESAPADVQATLQAMHDWSSTIDLPQLLQKMADGDTAAVQQIHDKAQGLVQQLEQQLEQVSEPVGVSWLRASGYGTYGLLLRTADWLAGQKDLYAAQGLADLVRVFSPASEPHLMLLADSAARAAAADAAGEQVPPEHSREVRVQQFVQAVVLRYGEVKLLEVLTALAGGITNSLGPHWLGLIDLNGQMGLDKLMKGAGEGAGAGADGGGRRKVELNLGQLGSLQG